MIKSYKGIMPQTSEGCYVADSAQVIGKVKLGKNVNIWECAVLRGDVDEITIDEGSNVQDGSVLHVNEGIPLQIGKHVTVGHGVMLHGCTIGDNSLIAIGAIILNGAIVGNNCIVGAGAVVTPNMKIPDGTMVLGMPAKVIRPLEPEEIKANSENASSYVALAKDYMTSF